MMRTSVTYAAGPLGTCDVFCDLLLNRHNVFCEMFVNGHNHDINLKSLIVYR